MNALLTTNVNSHTEKKNGLTYLSWAWAWAEVLKVDPNATWEAIEFAGIPACFLPDGSAMVKTTVTINEHTKACLLPVMDHRNKAIKNPDAFAINTSIVRCMTKTIAMFGLGLYIYAGEDMPQDGSPEPEPDADRETAAQSYEREFLKSMRDAAMEGTEKLQAAFAKLPAEGGLKTEFWGEHHKALKAAAAAADKGAKK